MNKKIPLGKINKAESIIAKERKRKYKLKRNSRRLFNQIILIYHESKLYSFMQIHLKTYIKWVIF